jgi:hypothetical protein
VITYYQKKRHIFGDLTVEISGPDGKSVGTIPSSKRRGLNRVQWSMRLKAPRVPTAASALFGAAFGPRVVPGNYTVKMTKDKNVYTTQLNVVADPRTTATADDLRAQFDLSMKLYNLLNEMTYAVDRINGVRTALDDRASKLPANDVVAQRLRTASSQVDEIRKKIVATKEGGMITGEERLRENLGDLYSGVIFYEGRPTQMQQMRTQALTSELTDVVKDFDAWATRQLPALNADLSKKKLEPIQPITREQWEASATTAP